MSSSSNQQAPEKKNKGRQKVKMQKMEKDSNLQVTFSKRRVGIFKKANELCVLCAAEALVIIFSPARKVFSFGHPDVEPVVNRFLNGDVPDPVPTNANIHQMVTEATRNYSIRTRNLELTQIRNILDVQRKRGEDLDDAMKKGLDEGWMPPSFDDFNLEQLEFFDNAVSNFQKHFYEELAKFRSLNLNAAIGFNDTNEQYATGSSVFEANNSQLNSFSFNNGITNNIGEATVPFSPDFNNWVAGLSNTGVYATGETSVTNNISSPIFPTEFTDWIPGFDNTGVYTGVANNDGSVSVQSEFDSWASSFNNGGFATVGTSSVNNVGGGAVSVPNEFNDLQTCFNGTRVNVTGETSNVGVQDPYDPSLIPDDLFTPPYDPNASDSFNLMTDNLINDIFRGGNGTCAFPGFNDGGNGPSQH